MKTHSQTMAMAFLAAWPAWSAVPDSTQSVSAGILLNLDGGGLPPAKLSTRTVPLEVTDAELHLGMRLQSGLEGRTVVVRDGEEASVQQAFATWKRPELQLDFGLQPLPLGLYAGGLVHHPLLQQDLERFLPSAQISRRFGSFDLHLVGAQLAGGSEDSIATQARPALVAAGDWAWAEKGFLRVHGLASRGEALAGAAVRIPFSSLLADLEGFAGEGSRSAARWGALAGILWNPVDPLECGVRYDARQPRPSDSSLEQDVAAGAVYRFASMAYAGVEWLQPFHRSGILTVRLGVDGEILGR